MLFEAPAAVGLMRDPNPEAPSRHLLRLPGCLSQCLRCLRP